MKQSLITGLLVLTALLLNTNRAGEVAVYIGTYTGEKSKGIYHFTLNDETGELKPKGLAVETTSPSFLAFHPNGKYLYAVGEVGNFKGKNAGSVSAFSIDAGTGKLTPLNSQSSGGGGPCYVSVDKGGRALLVANYGGGSVASLPIKSDGSLGEAITFIQHEGTSVNKDRQSEPHAHSINLDKDNNFAFVADLGLDKILVYAFDKNSGALTATQPGFARVKPGGGPRHFAFHPNGKFAYANLEMGSSVTAFSYNSEKGELKEKQSITTLPNDFKGGNSTAEIQVHPGGRFVYCSNRGHDSIAVYKVDEKSGNLTYVENEPTQGRTPRNFGIDPSGKFLIAANQGTDSLVVFRINETTGELDPTGFKVECPSPVCVKFLKVRD
jgi:6-phosphogluconolactonase